MGHHILAGPPNKFWFICLVLFLFWYLLLHGIDWTSLPRLSSVPSFDDDDDENRESFGSISLNDVPDDRGNATLNHERSKPAAENDVIPELEPLLPKEDSTIAAQKRRLGKPCAGRYVYVHDIPSRFNYDYLQQCKLMNKWQDMCQYLENGGLGRELGNPQKLFLPSGWYGTHQFTLEVIFHSLMKQYECLTDDSSKASAIYVPYYPGLDVSRYLWDRYNSSLKDADALDLFEWLRATPEWDVMGGRDHFVVSGRITWDLRRGVDEGDGWGSKLMLLPQSQNMTMLTIESSPWDKNDFAIPYPTYFHPSSDDQVLAWKDKIRRRKRRSLFCFAGAPRPDMKHTIRGEIMQQCGASGRRCRMLECKDEKHNCLKPANVMRMFESCNFCLQPPGDSFTRRSTFDSIVAGCIPVLFNPGSAYVQYLWHLPKDFGLYSVLISEEDVKEKRVSIENVLSKIPRAKVKAMREEVIRLIPNVIYSDPRSRLENLDDAFDLALRGVIGRIQVLKTEMREGRNSSVEFDSESSWKYYTFGTTQPHEWDRYFNRSKW